MTIRHRLPGTPEPMLMLPGADGLQIAADCWGNETNEKRKYEHANVNRGEDEKFLNNQ